MRTIEVNCLNILKGVKILLFKVFNKFWTILDITNLALLLVRRHLLKLVQYLYKCNTRIARLYIVGIGTTTRQPKQISTKLNNPDNRYLLSDSNDNEAT